MEYEDRLTIATPEGLELELVLAGLGSRFIAALLDGLLRLAVGGALVALVLAVTDGGLAVLLLSTLALVLLFLYDLFFEVYGSGRTPGKRWAGLRVLRETGDPVGLSASAVRNVIRLLDFLPGFYVVAMVAVLATRRNQRVGDVVAGTVVVREQRPVPAPQPPRGSDTPAPRPDGWDLTALSADDVAIVTRFLARRDGLELAARARLAAELERSLRTKVTAPPGDPEPFLEQLAARRAETGRAP